MMWELVGSYINDDGQLIDVWENEQGLRRKKDCTTDAWVSGIYDPNAKSEDTKSPEVISDG